MNRTRARPRDDMGRHPGCSTCSAPLRSARTAAAAHLGQIALSGFALAYARSARRLGWRSSVAGALAALPSVASVLTVSTHQQHGVDAVLDLLRGMLGGMAAFVLFCALIGLLVEPAAWPPRSSLRPRRPC
jgi:hypothetical protein